MKTLFERFRAAVMRDPKASRKDAFDSFLDDVEQDRAAIRAMAEDYFYRQYAQWKPEKIGKSFSLVGTPVVHRRAEVSTLRNKIAREMKQKVRDAVLLDLEMPNGKKARECTGAELARIGGFWTEVARYIKPTQVLDKRMTERDLRNIYSRFNNGNRAA